MEWEKEGMKAEFRSGNLTAKGARKSENMGDQNYDLFRWYCEI
jgi:hypothetical protein